MMTQRFQYFVVLAGMRTGSNLLEEQLNTMPGLACHGELFNPHFLGKPDVKRKWGFDLAKREKNPLDLIKKMVGSAKDLPGFRLFFDHDRRVLDHVLQDRSVAKILLSRRPIDSYVSLKIARTTDQWWLGDMTSAKAAKVSFDLEEYADFLNDLAEFEKDISFQTQVSGQTVFRLSYEDLSNEDILNGLGTFLGANGPLDTSKVRAKVQNPKPLKSSLTNPEEAGNFLSQLATPDLGRFSSHEPVRGPGLKFFKMGQSLPLIYMPIRGAWQDPIPNWMLKADPEDRLLDGIGQKDLRRWKRAHPGHLSFTVLRHPLMRAHDAFCRHILPIGPETFDDLRHALKNRYGIGLPDVWPTPNYGLDQHKHLFLAFLKFLAGNLGGQTSLRVDNTWASQSVLMQALAEFGLPDRVIRSERLSTELPELASLVGVETGKPPFDRGANTPFDLAEVVTGEIETACEKAYRRDYVMYGFKPWQDES